MLITFHYSDKNIVFEFYYSAKKTLPTGSSPYNVCPKQMKVNFLTFFIRICNWNRPCDQIPCCSPFLLHQFTNMIMTVCAMNIFLLMLTK